jgi:hypothetical protein
LQGAAHLKSGVSAADAPMTFPTDAIELRATQEEVAERNFMGYN